MTEVLTDVRVELGAFAAGGPFAPLWRAVMAAAEMVDTAPGLSDADRWWYDAVYEAVYMGADDPVPPTDRGDGVVGAAELRGRLQPLAGGETDVAPAERDAAADRRGHMTVDRRRAPSHHRAPCPRRHAAGG